MPKTDTSVTISAERYAELIANESDAKKVAEYDRMSKLLSEQTDLIRSVGYVIGGFQYSDSDLPQIAQELRHKADRWDAFGKSDANTAELIDSVEREKGNHALIMSIRDFMNCAGSHEELWNVFKDRFRQRRDDERDAELWRNQVRGTSE